MGPTTRRRGFPGGLRAQLLLGLGGLVLITLTLVSIISVHTTRLHLQQMQLENVYRLATLLAEDIAVDPSVKSAFWERFLRGSGLSFAGVWSADENSWNPKVESDVEQALTALVLAKIEKNDENKPYRAHKIVRNQDGLQLVAVVSSVMDSSEQGLVLAGVSVDLGPVQAKIDEAKSLMFLYLLLDLLFLTIVGYAFFTYLVVRPIRAIGVAAERAAAGDLASTISLLPGNEFGQVGRSFNRMLVEIEQNRTELEARLQAIVRTNRELNDAHNSLIRAEKLASVGQLSAGVAHEIGNPLAAILGYTDYLRDTDLDEEMRDDIVDRVQTQLERIQKIIGELVDFSRDESEQAAEPTDLARCVSETLHLMRAHPRAEGVEFRSELDAGSTADLPTVWAVHSAVVQVLLNLMINAADALRDCDENIKRTVWIRARTGEKNSVEDSVVLEVADNGPGIAKEAVNRLFDPFFTTKDPGQGTGLGLATCLRIMQRFGGDIRVLNPEDSGEKGAVFELVFRCVDKAQKKSAAEHKMLAADD